MVEEISEGEIASDRQKDYSEFYSAFLDAHFTVCENFISLVKDVLDSGSALPGAFENGNNLLAHQCAYFVQFGVHDACLGEEKFRKSAAECKKIQELCSKRRINVCCLGSQSLLVVLGVLKVIEEYARELKFSNERRLQVQILIIDKNEAWKDLSEYFVNAAKKKYPELKIKLDFLVKDITEKFSKSSTLRMELSHIVIMSNYLSSLTSETTVAKITKNTLAKMKKNAVLFYLDHDTRGDLNNVKNLVADSKSFSEMACSEVPQKYTLHKDARNFHLSSHQFLSPLNVEWDTYTAPVTFATWIKNTEIKLKCDELKQEVPAEEIETAATGDKRKSRKRYKARSSNRLRNSTETYKLVGKFAHMDMEKKNKDDSHRLEAKEATVSRYASFDD